MNRRDRTLKAFGITGANARFMKTWAATLLFALIAGCGGGSPQQQPPQTNAPVPPPKPADENAALAAISAINSAQKDYFTRNRRYALTYEELIEEHFLREEPSRDKTGYEIKMRPSADAARYTVSATPLSPSSTTRYFFTDQSGDIRAEQGNGASALSPKVEATNK